MGFLNRLSSTLPPGPRAASTDATDPFHGLYGAYLPPQWISRLSHAGIAVTPDLAMTLSAVYCAVKTIADDIATMPCHLMRWEGDEGDKARERRHPLADRLRWAPNRWQTAKEFWACLVAHVLLRNVAFAEIVPGPSGAIDQLIPRHPDRVTQERLPDGTIRFVIRGLPGEESRTLLQDEMFVIRDLTTDGLTGLSRVGYGTQSVGLSLAQERHTSRFFRSGATAALVATHKGGALDDDEAAALHASLMRYAGGVENAHGVLLIEDDIDIKSLGIDPEKAQLLELKNYSVAEIARLFQMPAHKLQADQQAQAYAAREQANLEYLMGPVRQMVVGIEQAIHRDLIVEQDRYFAEFVMEALLRGDLKSRSEYYAKAIQNRWMWPSEVRRREGLNGDPQLDELSMQDHRPADARSGARRSDPDGAAASRSGHVRAVLLAHDGALRCLRRERAAVARLAERHASDVPKWHAALREFYEDQARFMAEVLRVPLAVARTVAADHGARVEAQGLPVFTEAWERETAEALTSLAVDPDVHAAA